jgi:Ca2+-binding RTX toxin-like protein
MVGAVKLGPGDDRYDGQSGRVGSVEGAAGTDTLNGGAFADVFDGGADGDMLNGGGGNDFLVGGTGADLMIGGTGNDVFVVDNAGDIVSESGGTGIDLVQSSISFNLANAAHAIGAVESLMLLNVATALSATGNGYNNTLSGNNFANTLSGLGGNDTLNGGLGNDRLFGGAGNDRLTGGANSDFFVFNTAPNASTNRDTVTDFNHIADTFQLENVIFTKLGAGVHLLNPGFFRAGVTAADANDYIVYNKATGILSYDNDGNGSHAAIAFAFLQNKPVLAANDFVVI